ncbi:hypothetical protein [Methylobacterium sp. DB0501]|uniref:hypothetical protein n=1 Tax=Methylobacterium sp. DB0501 TaxID=2709665 RepID=UPI0013EDE19C|nr:hypothetical protein [Methylobacterium sp. DB0501]
MSFVTRTGIDEAVHRGDRRLVLCIVNAWTRENLPRDRLEHIGEHGISREPPQR